MCAIVFVYQAADEAAAVRDDGYLVASGPATDVLIAAGREAQGGTVVLGPGTWPAAMLDGVKYVGVHHHPERTRLLTF